MKKRVILQNTQKANMKTPYIFDNLQCCDLKYTKRRKQTQQRLIFKIKAGLSIKVVHISVFFKKNTRLYTPPTSQFISANTSLCTHKCIV